MPRESKSSARIHPMPYTSHSRLPALTLQPLKQTTNSGPGLGFFQSLKDGIGLGAGSAIGNRIVNSIAGSASASTSTSTSQSVSEQLPVTRVSEFKKCMEDTYQNYEACKDLL